MTGTLVAPLPRDWPARRRRLRPNRRLHDLRRDDAEAATDAVPVVLIDDDAMARSWLRLSLRDSEFKVELEAASAAQARPLFAPGTGPMILLVDHRLPDAGGLELIRELRARGVEGPALLLATNSEPGLNEAARDAGAQGTLLKTGSPSELLDALRAVLDGEQAFDARHPRRHPVCAALTPREREVLSLVAEGATNGEIASVLGIGVETVKTLLRRAFAKLGVQRRVQAVWAARELGIV
jgi:DNA-binding NarL/FixJ family response regulator